jgi:hypothetical protein
MVLTQLFITCYSLVYVSITLISTSQSYQDERI